MIRLDCIAMKQAASLKLSQQLAGMTHEEQLIFWQQGTNHLRERQRQLRNIIDMKQVDPKQ